MSLVICTVLFWYGLTVRSWSSFKTLQTIETNPRSNEDLKELLQFWTCFAVITLFDAYVEMFVSWVPLYPMFKLFLLWYVINPNTKGAQVVFDQFIAPKFQDKLFFLEKTFLVDVVSNFIELDWMYEQLTVQVSNRLDTVSSEQLQALQNKLKALVNSIGEELEYRRISPESLPSTQIPMATIADVPRYPGVPVARSAERRLQTYQSAEADEFEHIRRGSVSSAASSRTPSPQKERASSAGIWTPLNVFRSPAQQPSAPVVSPSGQTLNQSNLSQSFARQVQAPSTNLRSMTITTSPPVMPSFLPTRGIQVVHVPLSPQEVEDEIDETLRSLEMDEATTPERRESNDIVEEDSLLRSAASKVSTSALETLTRRFSWMSSRWPSSYSAGSRDEASSMMLDEASQLDEDDFAVHEDNVGPVTRSKARQTRLSQHLSMDEGAAKPARKLSRKKTT